MTANPSNPALGFIFPGQGSQSVGMMSALHSDFPQPARRFENASDVLGFDLWKLVDEGPEADLNSTRNTQPALLAASVACWDVWLACGGPQPALMAGHSFGEYSALVCAGALDFTAGIELAAARGRFMQEAVAAGEGAMAAILGLDLEQLIPLCEQASVNGELSSCANLNAPGQIVIAGTRKGVADTCELAKAAGARRALELAVSAPAHCALMRPAAEQLSAALASVEFRTPQIPILHNVDVAEHATPNAIRDALVQQMSAPVRWIETIEAFGTRGVSDVVECGPGKVLGALVKRINRNLKCHPAAQGDAIRAAIESLSSESS